MINHIRHSGTQSTLVSPALTPLRRRAVSALHIFLAAVIALAASGSMALSQSLQASDAAPSAVSVAPATTIGHIERDLQEFLEPYGLQAELTTIIPSTYVSRYDTYAHLTERDAAELRAYLKVFKDEWRKYPTDWVAQSGLQKIAFVKQLAVQGQPVAGSPDPVGKALYFDVTYGIGDDVRHTIHHEYGHLIEHHYHGTYARHDTVWNSFNPQGFRYGNGGWAARHDGTYLPAEHPMPGFVTRYATYGIEEDKAEVYAYIMTDYRKLSGWAAGDPLLARKVASYKSFIQSKSPSMNDAYLLSVSR